MTIRSAPLQLAELAAVMRPDWDRAQFEGALQACRLADWSWPRTFKIAADLMATEDASPRDLTAATQSPFSRKHERSVAPTDEWHERRAEIERRGGAA